MEVYFKLLGASRRNYTSSVLWCRVLGSPNPSYCSLGPIPMKEGRAPFIDAGTCRGLADCRKKSISLPCNDVTGCGCCPSTYASSLATIRHKRRVSHKIPGCNLRSDFSHRPNRPCRCLLFPACQSQFAGLSSPEAADGMQSRCR